MSNPNSDDFKTISTEIKDWYRQAMTSVQGSMFIRVKDAKPGSVITSQNINVLNPELQDKDLYDDIYRALRTAIQIPGSLGMDPTSLTLLSATTCYGETVSVTDQFSNRVNLTFPSIAGDTHAYSVEKCADNTESAGVPLAVRRCTGSFETGVSWGSPELLDCGFDLSRLAQMPITPDNAEEVAADLQILTSNGSSLMAENIADASTVLDNLANTTGDQNVGYSVMVSVDQIMNSADEVLYQSQVKDQSLSRIVRAIEQFNDRVNLTTKPFRRIEQNIGVETYKIGATDLVNSVGFASLDDSGDLEDGSTVLFISKQLFLCVSQDSSDEEVRLSFIIYQNSRLFQSNQTASSSSKTRVNSRIIASRVTGFEFKNLSNPVVTRYLPIVQNSTNRTVDNIRCVFWDFQAEGGAGAWSTEGCDFVGVENGRVVCECNHLTNFAVLMDIYGDLHSFALDVISKVGIALSITGLTLTLITYMIFKELRQTRPQHILTNLCIALLATLVIFLAGIDATSSPVGCTVVSFLLHYFLLAVFMWMAVEAVNMYLAFVIVLGAHVSRFMLKAAIFAWGLPLVIPIVTLAVDIPSTYPNEQETYRSTEFCWLQGNQLYFGFLLPAGLVLLFNTIVYIVVISKLVCGKNEGRVVDHKSGGTKQNLRIAMAVMVLVGLTWVFGFFMISDGRIVFSYLFCIFNSLQGFFIFIFHTLRQKEVQNLWTSFCRRVWKKEVQNLWFKYCACFVDDARTTKTSAGKSSSNLVESNEESYSRGAQRGNGPESVPMEVFME
ncbi:adhesion G-protein coupled receptor G7-like [Branchiostoma floridae x Branchiostoma japonicum]